VSSAYLAESPYDLLNYLQNIVPGAHENWTFAVTFDLITWTQMNEEEKFAHDLIKLFLPMSTHGIARGTIINVYNAP
jgi:hypothetical protein